MTIETKALKLVSQLESIYYREKDVEGICALLTEDVVIFGADDNCIYRGIEGAATLFAAQRMRFSGYYDLEKSAYHTIALGEQDCLVFGLAGVWRELPQNSLEMQLHVSALCRQTPQGLRIAQMHLSYPGNLLVDRELRTLMENIPGGIFRCKADASLTLLQMNEGFLQMFGYTREEIRTIFHDSFWEMIDIRDRESSLKEAERQLALGNSKELEYRVLCKDGRTVWVLDKGQLITDRNGQNSYYCVLVDITQGRMAQEELRMTLDRHQIIMDQTNDIIFEWDVAKDKLLFSPNWEKKFGYQPLTENVTKELSTASHIHPEDRRLFLEMLMAIKRGQTYMEAEFRLLRSDKEYVWIRARLTAQFAGKGTTLPTHAVGVLVDIDNEKRRSQLLVEKAERDALTNLYNKGTAERLIQEYLQTSGQPSAVLIIDVDDFKLINDTMGHLFGDAFLVEVAGEIRKQVRPTDVVGRIGGDEFIVCIKDIPSPKVAQRKAEQIIQAFRQVAVREREHFAVSCSIGIAYAPDHGTAFQELYRKSDRALYQAKKLGKNRYVVYNDKTMREAIGGLSKRIYSSVSTVIDSDAGARLPGGNLVDYVFQILYQTTDIESAINSILEIVGKQFDVSRVYIFENTEDNLHCVNTFEWCNEGIAPMSHSLQCVSYADDLDGEYMANFNAEGVFYCRDVELLPMGQRELLKRQGIKSILQCSIVDGEVFRGYVGFDECGVNRYWTQNQVDALTFISRVLSTFLLKERSKSRAEQNAQAMQAILDNQDCWIYLIHPESCQLVYINQKVQKFAGEARLGAPCYKAFFDRQTPCEQCPARQLGSQRKNCTLEMYHEKFHVWTSTTAALISWKGEPMIALTCQDITPYKTNERLP